MLVRRLALVVVLAWVLGPLSLGSVRAQGAPPGADSAQGIAIVRIDIFGENPPGLVDELDARLAQAIEEAGFTAKRYAEVGPLLEDAPALADCISSNCLRELPALLGTNLFLRLRVESSGSIYDFEMLLLAAEGDGGDIKAQEKGSCPVCTTDEFLDEVSRTAAALTAAYQPLAVEIRSQPAGATMVIDGRELGPGPFSGRLAPGMHRVRAELDGHLPAEQDIEVVAGADGPQAFTLTLTEAPDTGGGLSGGEFGVWKWSAAAAALGTVTWGVTWVIIDGRGTCDNPNATGCPRNYNTGTYGYVLTGVGVAMGAAAGYMFWRDGRASEPTEHAAMPVLAPVAGGAVGGWQMRF